MVSKSSKFVHHRLQSSSCPDQIFIFGGGRWARVIAQVLCDMLPPSTHLTMYSPRGILNVLSWVSKNKLEHRISVEKLWPETFPHGSSSVIVANAAHDHFAAASWALERGADVLVEKPLSMSLRDLQRLISFASTCKGQLVSAHVFRYTRYIENFSRLLPCLDRITFARFDWIDPVSEHRHGEQKNYDSTIPVYVDCLPHAISVIQSTFQILPRFAGPPTISAGGAKVQIPLSVDSCSCIVSLQRNGTHRLRRLTVKTTEDSAVLDFSCEPGFIRLGKKEFDSDPLWDRSPTPLSSLLEAFLLYSSQGKIDARLELDTGLAACSIADAITPFYQAHLFSWLFRKLISATDLSPDAYYAINELLVPIWNKNKNETTQNLQDRIELLKHRITPYKTSQLTPSQIRKILVHLG